MHISIPVDEIVDMKDEEIKISSRLRDFNEYIRQILMQRVPLLRRLNHIHHIFPDEILCAIFEYTSTTDKNDNPFLSPLILGAVCFRWRQIVWNSPSLWRNIGTIPNPRRPVRPSDVELLRLHFQNAGTHSVNLKFRLDGLPPGRTAEELIQVFVENSAKIQWLKLSGTNSSEVWDKFAAAVRGCHLDNLHSLSFVGRKPIHRWFSRLSFQAPHMRSVSFEGLYLSTRQFPFHLIQVLQLKNIVIGRCLKFLAHAPALQEFYCSRTNWTKLEEEEETISDHGLTTLHHLKILDVGLGHTFKQWETFFFTHFRFPQLKKLVWGTSSPLSLESRSTTWMPFFSAMESIVDFTYQSEEYSKRELSGILQALGPSVRRISIPCPAAQLKWQSVLNAIQLSKGRVPGCSRVWHVELFLSQQNMIFQQNHEEIKERLRGVGLEIDFIKF